MKGLEELHRRHGRLPWKDLFAECIALAEKGQEITADLRDVSVLSFWRPSANLTKYVSKEIKGTSRKGTYMEDKMYSPFFDDQGELLAVGQIYYRKEYAGALRMISEGVEAMYDGELGQGIVRAVQASGGLMTMDDLRGELWDHDSFAE